MQVAGLNHFIFVRQIKAQVAGGHLKGLQQRKDALLLKPAAMR